MNHTIDGGGSGVGIDPEALDTLITDADSAAENIESFTSTYRGRFSDNDVSTSNIGQLEGVAEWIRDQLPMLRRRRDLAQIAADQSGNSFVTAGAGELAFETSEDAAQAGQEDAERLLEDAEPGEIPDEVYELLQEHSGDPDYVEAFFNEAGPEVLQTIQYDAAISAEDDEYLDPGKMVPMSYALATASHRIDFTSDEWLHTAEGWNAFVPYMEYGTWNGDFLKSAANRLTHYTTTEQQATVLNALARNPVAAAEWYQADSPDDYGWDTNAELVGYIMQGEMHAVYNSEELDEALLNMMDAATLRAGRYDQELADQSVVTLLENIHSWRGDGNNEWNGSANERYQEWFGEVTERHIDDIYDSTTSPMPTYFNELREDRSGVEASAELWASLTEQAMRDEETAAYLSLAFQDKFESEVSDVINMESNDHRSANGLSLDMTDQFAGWFGQRTENVADALDKDVEEYNQGVSDAVDLLFSASDPKGLVKDLAVDEAKGIVTGFLEKDPPDWNVDTGWVTSREERLDLFVGEMYNNSGGAVIEPVTIVLERDDEGNTVRERTYDGDPEQYQEIYGGEFIEDGEIKDFDDIAKDENALRAYMEWIQDPAVQQWAYPNYRNQTTE